jgi:hypothetical protein
MRPKNKHTGRAKEMDKNINYSLRLESKKIIEENNLKWDVVEFVERRKPKHVTYISPPNSIRDFFLTPISEHINVGVAFFHYFGAHRIN